MECKICNERFDETKYNNKCPICGEKYYIISMTDYQKLVEEIQSKQYEIEQIYNQIWEEQLNNKFKNTLERERNIYSDFNCWLENIIKEFNIPKIKDYYNKPLYNKPSECQIHRGKICNNCGDC